VTYSVCENINFVPRDCDCYTKSFLELITKSNTFFLLLNVLFNQIKVIAILKRGLIMKTVMLYFMILICIAMANSCSTVQYSNINFPSESQQVIGIILHDSTEIKFAEKGDHVYSNDSTEVKFVEKGGNVYLNEGQVEGKQPNGESISKKLNGEDEIYYSDNSYIKLGKGGYYNFKASNYTFLYSSSYCKPIQKIIIKENDRINEYNFDLDGAKGAKFDWRIYGIDKNKKIQDFSFLDVQTFLIRPGNTYQALSMFIILIVGLIIYLLMKLVVCFFSFGKYC